MSRRLCESCSIAQSSAFERDGGELLHAEGCCGGWTNRGLTTFRNGCVLERRCTWFHRARPLAMTCCVLFSKSATRYVQLARLAPHAALVLWPATNLTLCSPTVASGDSLESCRVSPSTPTWQGPLCSLTGLSGRSGFLSGGPASVRRRDTMTVACTSCGLGSHDTTPDLSIVDVCGPQISYVRQALA